MTLQIRRQRRTECNAPEEMMRHTVIANLDPSYYELANWRRIWVHDGVSPREIAKGIEYYRARYGYTRWPGECSPT